VITNNDGQTATGTGAYTYVAPLPTFTTITPASGPAAGGTAVIIVGTNFVAWGSFGVIIGGAPATMGIMQGIADFSISDSEFLDWIPDVPKDGISEHSIFGKRGTRAVPVSRQKWDPCTRSRSTNKGCQLPDFLNFHRVFFK
jgi:hypothetical protein